MTYNAAVLGF